MIQADVKLDTLEVLLSDAGRRRRLKGTDDGPGGADVSDDEASRKICRPGVKRPAMKWVGLEEEHSSSKRIYKRSSKKAK